MSSKPWPWPPKARGSPPPYLPRSPLPNGMGEVFSAIVLGALLRSGSVQEALEHAANSLFALVQAAPPGSRDLALAAAQDAIVAPPTRSAARSIA